MKKYIIASGILIVLATILVIAGCGHFPVPSGEETSSCVICHSDKEALKQTATAEVEEVSSETTGEG